MSLETSNVTTNPETWIQYPFLILASFDCQRYLFCIVYIYTCLYIKNQPWAQHLQVPVRLIDVPVHKQRGVKGIESRRGNCGFLTGYALQP